MPEVIHELDEKEVRMALRYWIESGHPHAAATGVVLSITPGTLDPREPSGPTITARVSITKGKQT